MKKLNEPVIQHIFNYLFPIEQWQLRPVAKVFTSTMLEKIKPPLRHSLEKDSPWLSLLTLNYFLQSTAPFIMQLLINGAGSLPETDLVTEYTTRSPNRRRRKHILWGAQSPHPKLCTLMLSRTGMILLHFRFIPAFSKLDHLPAHIAHLVEHVSEESQLQQLLWMLSEQLISTETWIMYHTQIHAALSLNLIKLLRTQVLSQSDLRFDFTPLMCHPKTYQLLQDGQITPAQIEKIPAPFRKRLLTSDHGYHLFQKKLISLQPAALTVTATFSPTSQSTANVLSPRIKMSRLASLFKAIDQLIGTDQGKALTRYLSETQHPMAKLCEINLNDKCKPHPISGRMTTTPF